MKNIACGMLDSFNSRNNDLSGYWGIGVLCLHAQQMKSESLVLDLLHENVEPQSVSADSLAHPYQQKLAFALQKYSIPVSWVKSALLTICFNPAYEPKYHDFRSALGGCYTCTLEITDDLGRKRSAKNGGICWPHNPKKETRSSRANDL